MRINHVGLALPVSKKLCELLIETITNKNRIKQTQGKITSITLNFRDPTYEVEKGGYHPVEIRLEQSGDAWKIAYITDFSYQGLPPYSELEKELDFDFTSGVAQIASLGIYAIEMARDVYLLWECNFISYASMNIYQVSISHD